MQLINSEECEEFLRTHWKRGTIRKHERAYAIYFNWEGKRLCCKEIGSGGYKGVVIDLRGTLIQAVGSNCDYVVIAHNHPSGRIEPSSEDITMADNIKQALSYFDVVLFDFMILTHENCFSFKENGLLKLKQAG